MSLRQHLEEEGHGINLGLNIGSMTLWASVDEDSNARNKSKKVSHFFTIKSHFK